MKLRWILCFFAIITSQAMGGDAAWKMAATPNYRILSQLNDRETAQWMRDFDQYILSISDLLKLDLRALPPLTVVIFASDKEYTPYKLLGPDGRTANVFGQFIRRRTWCMIAMAFDALDEHSRRTIDHEATHWMMSVDQSSQPAWFSEGIAELFSTFERRGDKVTWGTPITEHLKTLHDSGVMPLAQFLAEPSALFDREDHTERFYAQAWAFTHFMMFSKDPRYRQLLVNFLQTFRTQSGEATVNAVFGATMPEVEREFHIYIDQRRWTYEVQPVKPAADPPALQPAPPALVEAALGRLALGAGRQDLARQHAEKAIDLDTSAPDGHAVLAYLALDGNHQDLAVAQAEAALERGSKDSELYMLTGDSYVNGPNSLKPDATRARVSMYENAINLSPWRLDAYERLSDALMALDRPTGEDAKFLNVGIRAFPGDDWLRVGGAVVDDRLGHREAAIAELDAVLQPNSKVDQRQRDFATNVRGRWLIQTMNLEIAAALDKGDFAQARAVFNRYRDRIGKSPQIDSYMQDTDANLETSELTAKYAALVHDKKNAQARAFAKELLARPDLPANLRHYLEQGVGGTR
jgi:tetratricopeptide (TPR) repeat protein